MSEFERELVKEILSETQKTKQTVDWAVERLEKLAKKLLAQSEKDQPCPSTQAPE